MTEQQKPLPSNRPASAPTGGAPTGSPIPAHANAALLKRVIKSEHGTDGDKLAK